MVLESGKIKGSHLVRVFLLSSHGGRRKDKSTREKRRRRERERRRGNGTHPLIRSPVLQSLHYYPDDSINLFMRAEPSIPNHLSTPLHYRLSFQHLNFGTTFKPQQDASKCGE